MEIVWSVHLENLRIFLIDLKYFFHLVAVVLLCPSAWPARRMEMSAEQVVAIWSAQTWDHLGLDYIVSERIIIRDFS